MANYRCFFQHCKAAHDRTRRHQRSIFAYAPDATVDSKPIKSSGILATQNTKGRAVRARPCAISRQPSLPRNVPRTRRTGDVEQAIAHVAQGELIGLAAGDRAGGAIAAAVAGRDVDLTDIDCTDQAVTVG